MRSAVLLVVFNRPELTGRVIQAVREARPPRLYVAADGPRSGRPGEAQRCAEVRRIATAVDWPCEVRTLFRDENLGCGRAVSGAIDWFFTHEEEGIVLEDDVLPLASFFPYCDELLERYRDDERIGLVSGCNLVSSRYTPRESYLFTRFPHIWGWASWRRAWKGYDVAMRAWPHCRDAGLLATVSGGSWRFEHYWRRRFDVTYAGRINTWDYQWVFTLWRLGMVSVAPAINQTYNLGFGADATHTTAVVPVYVQESVPAPLTFPLRHPRAVKRDSTFEQLVDRHVFHLTPGWELRQRLLTVPVLGDFLRSLSHAFARF